MNKPVVGLCVGLLSMVILIGGCASQGEVINLAVPALRDPGNAPVSKNAGPKVGVVRFEDKRSNKAWLGTLTGRFGGEERFNVRGNDAGQAVANALADYLRSKGWQAAVVTDATQASNDVALSGEIQDLSVDAKKGFFSTGLTSKSKVMVQGSNRGDGSKVRMTLTGTGENSVFWFSQDDAQELVNDVLTESFHKLTSQTKFEGGALKLK
ncbi:hypothetical protein YTPLAS18_12370 [Nitrospira sp.]|nr:hypothetical protein YTPLAS18_12370 [Nitrospira sp.]